MKLTILAVALFFAGALFVLAQSSSEQQVLALEKVWSQASERGDTKALPALLDANIVYIDDDGSLMDRFQLIERMKTPSRSIREAMVAHVYGENVVVTGTYRTKDLDHGKPVVRRARFVHTWVSRSATWVCVSSEATPITP